MITKESMVRPTGKVPRKTDNRIGRRVAAYNLDYKGGTTILSILNALAEVGLGDIRYDLDRGYLEVVV